jgi:CDP-diacylglycerol--glycerol-3-phosphate 3-phosphatidyltransferase
MKLPTKVTMIRVLLSPFFAIAFFGDSLAYKFAALIIAILFEVTDVLDGYLARRTRQVTAFGKILDPFADSISRFTVFLCFLVNGWAHIGMIMIIFYRDCLVQFLRVHAASSSIIIAARTSGKIKAVVQGTMIIIVLLLDCADSILHFLPPTLPIGTIAWWGMAIVTVVTFASALDYLYGNLEILRKEDY